MKLRRNTGEAFFSVNKKKALTTFLVLILSVSAISLIVTLISSIFDECDTVYLNPFRHFSMVYRSSGQFYLSDSVTSKLKTDPDIEKLIPADVDTTSISLAIGGNTSVPCIFMNKSDSSQFLNMLSDTVSSGRLPKDGTNEIAVHWRILANKKWKLGQTVGSSKNSDEWLTGAYKIVGVLDGPNITVVGARSYRQSQMLKNGMDITAKPIAYVVQAKSGKLTAVNKTIKGFKTDEASSDTYDTLKKLIDKSLGSVNQTMTLIVIIVAVILAISVSALMYLIYQQRSEEFGILSAMGYRVGFIRRLVVREVVALNLISWAAGIVVSFGLIALLNALIYIPNGNTLNFFSPPVFYYSLVIPAMTTVFSILPVLVKLRSWDPITIIERRD